jgi:hypothetical protein
MGVAVKCETKKPDIDANYTSLSIGVAAKSEAKQPRN